LIYVYGEEVEYQQIGVTRGGKLIMGHTCCGRVNHYDYRVEVADEVYGVQPAGTSDSSD
jgi:hypothetical protein